MENLWALIKGNLPVFVMFYASWCPHCRKMLPIVRKLENNKHLNLQCFDIDDPANRRLVDYYQVQAVPLMMIYKAGEQLWRWNGEIEEERIDEKVKSILRFMLRVKMIDIVEVESGDNEQTAISAGCTEQKPAV